MDYELLIDSCTDLPLSYVKESGVIAIPLPYTFKGEDHLDDFGVSMNYKEFYDEVRQGEMPTTSQINVYTYEEIFRKITESGKDIVYLCLSSGLSGSFNNATLAANSVMEVYLDRDIKIIDSLSVSLGEGLFAWNLIEKKKEGYGKKQLIDWAEANRMRINHYFTVDDLNHLKRGGRVSSPAAFVGTILDIKPILIVDKDGHLVPIDKVKGRKKSIKVLMQYFRERVEDPEGQTIAISHGDAEEDAKYLEKMIRQEYNIGKVIMNNIGPVVGSHSGPGTLALFFLGKDRRES